ncbi:hypothetical protein AB0H83_39420 [Dactylosporangium sp. NPDC050688]|uniref:hypothetical protein n=1 Tax=Dactylosporangium sp. NPDC050688 TaxID=3157217 RepID=UPI0033E296B1
MTTNDYPVILAVEDFVPTLLALAGFWLLAGLGPAGRVTAGRAGAVLIGAGGLAKSVWKLLVAGFGGDLPWLEAALFPLMSAGAVTLVWALLPTAPWWPFAAVYAAVAGGALVAGAMKPVFVLATAGVTTVSVIGAVYAGRRRARTAIALYTLGIVLVTALVPLRNHPDHETLRLQWIEQGTNTAAQLAFLTAAWLTVRAYRRSRPHSLSIEVLA